VLQAVLTLLLASALRAESGATAKSLYPLESYGLEGPLPALQGKVVLLDFWASWCGPCAKSFPALDALYKEYRERGVVVLGVNVDENRPAMDKFLTKVTVSFPIVRDPAHKLVEKVNVASMPTSVMLDRNGRERFRHNGFRGEETIAALRADLEALLGEP
jgi:thiol-disulfide isomerase/thioredoxin